MDALRAQSAGSPVGSHSTYKQLRCLLYGAVPTRGANDMINEVLTENTSGYVSKSRRLQQQYDE